MEGSKYNLKIQKYITALAILLFIIKMTAWWLTQSVAILTDALESTVNVAAALLGLYSLYVSAKPRDKEHPYGHGKVEFISSAVEGTAISIAGLYIIYEAVQGLINPKPVTALDKGIILVTVTAIINYAAGYYCIKTGRKNKSLVLVAGGKHLQSDAYTTIGIVAGLILLMITKIWWIDAVLAIIFSVVIIHTGVKIIRESIAGIMDEADEALLKQMVEVLNSKRRINWIDLHNMRIIKYGPKMHIDVHMTMPWYFNINEAHHEVDELCELVNSKFSELVEIDVHNDGCLPANCPICHKGDCPVRQALWQKTIHWTPENVRQNSKHDINTV